MIFGRWEVQWRRWAVLVTVWVLGSIGQAANVTPNTRDTLAYKDGDRVQGVLIEQTSDTIVFKADRFGELRVAVSDAVVIKAEKATPAAAGTTPPPVAAVPDSSSVGKARAVSAEEKEEEERMSIWDRFSPAVLTAAVRDYFGPWHGRLIFSAEVVTDFAERSNSSYEAHLQRKWKSDEVQLNARFDYSETDDIATTDVLKLWGQWRHEFSNAFFGHYRPTGEWNRASKLKSGVPNDYVLVQQELGVGYHLLTKPSRKVRVGVSQNLFDTWNTAPVREHVSRGVISTFEEVEFTMPWRITLTQRGVWYPVRSQADGWENRVELNKKLTETLSTSLRHEIRRNNPDGTAQDYTRLKLLFGLDF